MPALRFTENESEIFGRGRRRVPTLLMEQHGEGTVEFDKTKGRYFARIPIGVTSKGTTKYARRYAKTKTEAQQLRREQLNERDNPTPKVPQKTIFGQFALQHLEGGARNELREVTRRGYLLAI